MGGEEALAGRSTSHPHAWVHTPGGGTIQQRRADVCADEFNLSGRQACEMTKARAHIGGKDCPGMLGMGTDI